MATDLRVLGVDPSMNRTGWAVLTSTPDGSPYCIAAGAIAPAMGGRGDRLVEISRRFDEVLRRYRPHEAYFEAPGAWQRRGGIRRETLEVMGMARGVMLAACADAGVPAAEIDFHTVRLSLLATRRSDRIPAFLRGLGLTIPCRPRGGPDLDVANAMLMAFYGLRVVSLGDN